MKQLFTKTVSKLLEPVKQMIADKKIPQRVMREVIRRANIDVVATGYIHPDTKPKHRETDEKNQAQPSMLVLEHHLRPTIH